MRHGHHYKHKGHQQEQKNQQPAKQLNAASEQPQDVKAAPLMMPAVSSKLRIAKDAPAPPKKIEKEDEEIVPVHKKKSVKKQHKKHHKDDGAPKAGAEKEMYKSLKKKDASTSDL